MLRDVRVRSRNRGIWLRLLTLRGDALEVGEEAGADAFFDVVNGDMCGVDEAREGNEGEDAECWGIVIKRSGDDCGGYCSGEENSEGGDKYSGDEKEANAARGCGVRHGVSP
jgi:hypothetical protein